MTRILLEDVRFYSHHGVFEHETRDGNEFYVDVEVTYDENAAEMSDEIDDTISYVTLYEIVKKVMDEPVMLLETVAMKITGEIASRFPRVESVSCKVTKHSPPIAGFIGRAAVEHTRHIKR